MSQNPAQDKSKDSMRVENTLERLKQCGLKNTVDIDMLVGGITDDNANTNADVNADTNASANQDCASAIAGATDGRADNSVNSDDPLATRGVVIVSLPNLSAPRPRRRRVTSKGATGVGASSVGTSSASVSASAIRDESSDKASDEANDEAGASLDSGATTKTKRSSRRTRAVTGTGARTRSGAGRSRRGSRAKVSAQDQLDSQAQDEMAADVAETTASAASDAADYVDAAAYEAEAAYEQASDVPAKPRSRSRRTRTGQGTRTRGTRGSRTLKSAQAAPEVNDTVPNAMQDGSQTETIQADSKLDESLEDETMLDETMLDKGRLDTMQADIPFDVSDDMPTDIADDDSNAASQATPLAKRATRSRTRRSNSTQVKSSRTTSRRRRGAKAQLDDNEPEVKTFDLNAPQIATSAYELQDELDELPNELQAGMQHEMSDELAASIDNLEAGSAVDDDGDEAQAKVKSKTVATAWAKSQSKSLAKSQSNSHSNSAATSENSDSIDSAEAELDNASADQADQDAQGDDLPDGQWIERILQAVIAQNAPAHLGRAAGGGTGVGLVGAGAEASGVGAMDVAERERQLLRDEGLSNKSKSEQAALLEALKLFDVRKIRIIGLTLGQIRKLSMSHSKESLLPTRIIIHGGALITNLEGLKNCEIDFCYDTDSEFYFSEISDRNGIRTDLNRKILTAQKNTVNSQSANLDVPESDAAGLDESDFGGDGFDL